MYTLGSWHIGTKEAHHCVYDNHGWWIADASPLGKDDETKTNAILIAAAPDLLEALEFIVNDTPMQGEDAELTTTGYNKACAAIAKAKGG